MATLSYSVRGYVSLLDALEAARNRRAMGMLGTSFVVAGLLGALAIHGESAWRPTWPGALGLLAGAFIAMVGINAAGIALLDESRALTGRTRAGTWRAAAAVTLRLMVLGLAMSATLAFLALVFAGVFWACRVLFSGALPFAFVLAAGILVLGVAFFGSVAAVLPVALPALWAGEGIAGALARGTAVLRSRLPSVLVLLFVLLLVVASVAFVAASVFGLGWLAAGWLAVPMSDLLAGLAQGAAAAPAGGSDASGPLGMATAQFVGVIAAAALALVPPVLVQLKGLGLIYLAVAPEMDALAAEAQMREYLARLDRAVRSARHSFPARS